jgi:hypothetical protein
MPDSVLDYSLEELIACAERELRMRERVYPLRVREGKMSRQQAESETRKMQAIVFRLKKLAPPLL